jgi:3-deoxy-D-manno-octulosonate 8-phosphate phosphatase (KDO 8-P phosphatase)
MGKVEFLIPELIVYDFDGVMTDNKAILSEEGIESVKVNRGDGLAVRLIKDELNIKQLLLSTEKNPIVKHRAAKLGIEVLHDIKEKSEALINYCKKHAIDITKALYIGNDINDYDAMKLCGLKMCPADSEPEIIEIADLVINKNGGEGVVRELYRLLRE